MKRGRDKFKRAKGILNLMYGFCMLFPRNVRMYFFERRRNTCGTIGFACRYVLLKSLASQVGDNVAVFPGVYFRNIKNLSIGNNVSIHPECYIDANGGISIGSDCSIAQGVSIISAEHKWGDLDIPIKDQGTQQMPVTIESNVWLGAKATVLGGVHIKSGSIIGAMALVNKDVEANCVVGGIPAKVIKHRTDQPRYVDWMYTKTRGHTKE